MKVVEWQKGDFLVSTDREKLQLKKIHVFLQTAYWSKGIQQDVVQEAIENSCCFGLYNGGQQIGLARMITDKAIFGYLADVYVVDEFRGQGLGKWLVSCVMEIYNPKKLRRILLATREMHRLYEHFGFERLQSPENLMEINRKDLYLNP